MKRIYAILLSLLVVFCLDSCDWKFKITGEEDDPDRIEIQRYDRLESRYLTTGDFSALQQMNIDYPKQTRMLIEDILQLGEVNDAGINTKLLNFYQDTILQTIIAETDMQYANMSDINTQLSDAFKKLQKICPEIKIPTIYTQISALNQSIVIGDNTIGISLDKYLGKDFEPYRRFYTKEQRQQMTREQIVPDCMSFYLLSLYPMRNFENSTQQERDMHMGKIMWTVNRLLGRKVFNTKYTAIVDRQAKQNPKLSVRNILEQDCK